MFIFGVFKLKYSTFWLINLFYFVNNALLLVTNANSQHALLFNILVCFYIRQRWILNSFWVWSYGFTIIHTINLWNTLHACSGFTKPCRTLFADNTNETLFLGQCHLYKCSKRTIRFMTWTLVVCYFVPLLKGIRLHFFFKRYVNKNIIYFIFILNCMVAIYFVYSLIQGSSVQYNIVKLFRLDPI